jgi:hypothetical protein
MESARSAQGGPHYWARGRTDALLTLHTRTAARLGAFDRANALYLQFALHDILLLRICRFGQLEIFLSTTH